MRWAEVVAAYPNQWLVVEAIESRVDCFTPRRVLERVRVVELCADGRAALHVTREYQRAHPTRTTCCVHTSYPSLEFDEPAAPPRASSPTVVLPAR